MGCGECRHRNDGDNGDRLTAEFVPSTCWYTNVRSYVSKAVWDWLRRQVAADAGQRCEVCGGAGPALAGRMA
jgi:hypothetical protein